jgi:hypothetical protein
MIYHISPSLPKNKKNKKCWIHIRYTDRVKNYQFQGPILYDIFPSPKLKKKGGKEYK